MRSSELYAAYYSTRRSAQSPLQKRKSISSDTSTSTCSTCMKKRTERRRTYLVGSITTLRFLSGLPLTKIKDRRRCEGKILSVPPSIVLFFSDHTLSFDFSDDLSMTARRYPNCLKRQSLLSKFRPDQTMKGTVSRRRGRINPTVVSSMRAVLARLQTTKDKIRKVA